jgi:hypothetical protein
MDVSAWWVLWAFLGGGGAGVLLMAMMSVASAEEDRMGPLVDLRGTDSPDLPPAIAEVM